MDEDADGGGDNPNVIVEEDIEDEDEASVEEDEVFVNTVQVNG